MAKRANQPFTSFVGGARQRFKKDAVVPDAVAAKIPAMVYDDGADDGADDTPAPAKRAAKRTA